MSLDIHQVLEYYKKQGAPADQSALVSLLRELQQENNGAIPMAMLRPVAEGLGVKESYLQAVIKRIPSLRLADTHCLELCAGPNCGKSTDLAAFAEKLRGEHPDKVTLKFVPCMRLCGKGPNIKWDGRLYHRADRELLRRLVEQR